MGVLIQALDKAANPLGYLPDFTDLSVQTVDNEPGALTFKYLRDGVNWGYLDYDDVMFRVVEDGHPNTDYYILEDDTDDPAAARTRTRWATVSARGYMAVTEQGIVYPKGANAAGTNLYGLAPEYEFPLNTPGHIYGVLLNEAKARGCFPELTRNFSGYVDSAGVAWPKTYEVTYPAGTNLLQVLMDMIEDGWVDARVVGHELFLYVPDTQFGTRPDVLRYGQNVVSAPRKRSRRGIFSHMLTAGDAEKKAAVQVANPTTQARFGRREGFASDSRLTTTGALTGLGTNELKKHQQQREGFTLEMMMNPPGANTEDWPRPGTNFVVGDKIYYDRAKLSETEYQPLRVRSITKSWGDTKKPPTVTLELNDLFVKASSRISKQVGAVTGGSTTTKPPAPTAPRRDTIAPVAPDSVTVTGGYYLHDDGLKRSYLCKATITWPHVTLDSDGTPLVDLDSYDVSVSINGEPWAAARKSTDTTDVLTGLRPGDVVKARVRARDRSGNVSGFTESLPLTLASDTTPPPAPKPPSLTTRLGTVTASWDGLDKDGLSMPVDFEHCEVQRSKSSTFASGVIMAGLIYQAGGTVVVTGQPYEETWYYRLVAVDVAGNRSTPSASASIATVPLVTGDLARQTIDDIDRWILAAKTNLAWINEDKEGVIANHTVVTDGGGVRWSTRVSNALTYLWRDTVGPIPFKEGDRIRVTYSAYTLAGTNSATPRVRYGDGTGWNLTAVDGSPTTITTAPQDFTYEGVVPAGIGTNTTFSVGFATSAGVDVRVRNTRAHVMGFGDLLANGWRMTGKTTINGGALEADTVEAVAVKAYTLGVEKLAVGNTKNLAAGGAGEFGGLTGSIFDGQSQISFDTVDKPSELAGVFACAAGAGQKTPRAMQWDCEPGDEFLVDVWLKADKPNSRIYVEMRNQNNALGVDAFQIPGETGALPAGTRSYPVENWIVPTVWTKYTCRVVARVGVTKLTIGGVYFNHANGTEQNAVQKIAIRVRGRGTGKLMVDGSIEGKHVKANTFTGDLFEAGAMRTEHLAVGVLRSNLVPDPSMEEDSPITARVADDTATNLLMWRHSAPTSGSVSRVAGAGRSGAKCMMMNVPATDGDVKAYSGAFKVTPGKSYKLLLHAGNGGAGKPTTFTPTIWVGPTAGTTSTNLPVDLGADNPTTMKFVGTPGLSSWTPENFGAYTAEFTPLAGQTWAMVRIVAANTSASSTAVYVDDVSVVEQGVGGASEFTAAGLRLFDDAGDEVGAFVSNRPSYFSIRSASETVAAIGSDGGAAFTSAAITGTPKDVDGVLTEATLLEDSYGFSVGGEELADRLWRMPQGIVAQVTRNQSDLSIIGIQSEYGIHEISWLHYPGRFYRIVFSGGAVIPTENSMTALMRIRYRTGGAAPNISSGQARSFFVPLPVASEAVSLPPIIAQGNFINVITEPTEVRALLSLEAYYESASGSMTFKNYYGADYSTPVEGVVEDLGLDPTDTYVANNGGGVLYTGGSSSEGGSAPVTKKTYTSYWVANASESYGNFGARPESQLYQGYYSGTQGHQWASLLFTAANSTGGETGKTIAQALSGATISSVKLRLRNLHFHNNAGGKAVVRAQTSTSLITGTPGGTAKTFGMKKGENKWLDITSIATSGIRGVTLGKAPSTSLDYYGYFAPHSYQYASSRPQLAITYKK